MFDGLRGMGWLPRAEYARLRFEERASAYLANLSDRDAGAASGGEEPLPPVRLEDEMRAIADALGGVAAIFVTTMDARRGGRERHGHSSAAAAGGALRAQPRHPPRARLAARE